jgi:RNA polymerase sigma-70 factor, ECF subfamily
MLEICFRNQCEVITMDAQTNGRSIREQELIRMAAVGNLDAFNELVLAYQDMAYNHAASLTNDSSLAEDVTQESFIKAFRALSSFRGGSFRSLLLRILTNTAYDMLRRNKRHPSQRLFPVDDSNEGIESTPWLADPSISVQDEVEQHELTKILHRLLEELPGVYRNVLTLIDVHELEYGEVAQILNIPLGTVKSRLARARMQIKEKLGSNVNRLDELKLVT